MPYATNQGDGKRIFYEDDGGDGPAVVVHGGILDTVETLRMSMISQAIPSDEFRLIYVDHRGLGRSDAPHEAEAYEIDRRVADVVAVLDAVGVERAHFIGTSWGGRLGFGIGELAPQRVLSLVIGGQQPFAIDVEGPLTAVVGRGIEAAQAEGTEAFVRALEDVSGMRFPEPQRSSYLQNDPVAIHAAWKCAIDEGDIVEDLQNWEIPCLIFVGEKDADFHEQARRAAQQIPNAQFVSIGDDDHIGAHFRQEAVIEPMIELFRQAGEDRKIR